jgi:hypothetical protein
VFKKVPPLKCPAISEAYPREKEIKTFIKITKLHFGAKIYPCLYF